MDEYIKREAAIERLKKNLYASNPGSFSYLCFQDAINSVQEIPAADVEPVRHGRWICIRKGYGEYECSICHGGDSDCSDYYGTHVVTEQDYCPKCGAKMDEEGTHER